MTPHTNLRALAVLPFLATAFAACTPSATGTGPGTGPEPGTGGRPAAPPPYVPLTNTLPPIPAVEGALAIRVIHPTPNDPRPRVDSTFIYGNTGTGGAWLWIEGQLVPVAPNGAFIAYLPVPEDGAWSLVAEKGGQRVTAEARYAAPAAASQSSGGAAPSASTPSGVFPGPLAGTVTGGADTLATGSDAIYARPTPTGTYRWFFPRGARLTLVERRGSQYRAQLADGTDAWIDTTAVRPGTAVPGPAVPSVRVTVRGGTNPEVRVPAAFAPFLVEVGENEVGVTVYGPTSGEAAVTTDAFVTGASVQGAGAGAVRTTVALGRAPWGYRAFYERDGTLVVQIRRPPTIDAQAPLRGMRIVIDPGHPPAGATGPTGLYEGDANLAISLPLAEKLRARGAEVILTRTTREPLRSATNSGEELRARVNLAVSRDAHLLISVHNNAFGEGANPARAHGTSVYYFHPWTSGLAAALDREIVAVTGLPDIGARQSNLALVRPTWMPTALTESVFMPIPEQEAALRNPQFIDRLAEAHARGIEAYLRGRAR